MSLLASLAPAADSTIEAEKDSIGGGGSNLLDSGMYPSTVSMAYLNKSSGGALGLVLTLKTQTGKEIRETLWMSSGTAKGCKNYYETKNGEKKFLPGYNHANSLCLLSFGKEVSEMETEVKVVNVYSPEAKAEVPTKVEVLMGLLNKEIVVGLLKQTVNKTKKNDMTGVYEPIEGTKDENVIDKFFRASDMMTTAEIRGAANEANFAKAWTTNWSGKTVNKAKEVGNGTTGAPKSGGISSANQSKKPTSSLFG